MGGVGCSALGDDASDGCNTRNEVVLLAEAVMAPTVDGCKLTGGTWERYYDGQEATSADSLECVAHLGMHLRRALLALALIAAPLALLWAGLFTGPGWAGPLWICQALGLALLVGTCYRMLLGPVGQRLRAPARPQVPLSPEVQVHQRRLDRGLDPGPC